MSPAGMLVLGFIIGLVLSSPLVYLGAKALVEIGDIEAELDAKGIEYPKLW